MPIALEPEGKYLHQEITGLLSKAFDFRSPNYFLAKVVGLVDFVGFLWLGAQRF